MHSVRYHPPVDFDEWVSYGMTQGWCGPAVCVPHDGVPTSVEEEDAYDEGDDPCVHIIRLYPDAETKTAVESSHSPSVWRATNAGLPLPVTQP
jgi:hypothetical protein